MRKRRPRSAHPGVSLVKRTKIGVAFLRARWTDPDSGKRCEFTFESAQITTHEGRRAWMIRKSQELQQRDRELASGSPRHSGLKLADAVSGYFATAGTRLKKDTVDGYLAAAQRFLGWCSSSRIIKAEDLYPHHIASFVQWLAAQPAKAAVKGGRRTERAATTRRCGPGGINCRLRSLKTILNHLRRLGQLPHVTSDDIKDRLKQFKTPRHRPAFLRTAEIRTLLLAVLRHDADTFEMTRTEKIKGTKRTTPRYDPVAPFVVYLLLTGCRLDEALGLCWTAIDFDAKDERGHKVGEVVLRAVEVKTAHERAIDLGVCPTLRKILLALKLRAGGGPFVFGGDEPWTRTKVEKARKRLIAEYGAPRFCWSQRQDMTPALRATCGTFLTNAPGIYSGAAAFHSAKRLGHSVAIAERHYVGLVRGIPREASTLEAAMDIEQEVAEVLARAARAQSSSSAEPSERRAGS